MASTPHPLATFVRRAAAPNDPHDARERRPPGFWQKTVPSARAAGFIGATTLATAAAIEITRSWVGPPRVAAEIGHAISGVLVAVFVVSAFALVTRARALAPACVLAVYGLLAHGGALVLDGQTVGALFLGIVPLVALSGRATLDRGWQATLPTLPRFRASASAAPPAASPSPSTTHE